MAKIIITRGRPYEMLVDIKQPNSPTGATLPADAIAEFHIIEKGVGGKSLLVKAMTRVLPNPIPDPIPDTVFLLSLTNTETDLLPFELGFAEDGENFRSTCRAQITIDSPSSPDVQFADSFISDIYVADLGA